MRTVLLVDGGYLRAAVKAAGGYFDNSLITKLCRACFSSDEYLLRIMYYDALPFEGKVKRPVSGEDHWFQRNDDWLEQLGRAERFAVRLGTLSFRGWRPRHAPVTGRALQDTDFDPIFEQKGVDMRVVSAVSTNGTDLRL